MGRDSRCAQQAPLCYFCGARPAKSREHIPPKQLFKDVACDRITVPSCDEHNLAKGFRDDAIVKAMLLSLRDMEAPRGLPDSVSRLLRKAEQQFHLVKRFVTETKFAESDEYPFCVRLAHVSAEADIDSWVRMVTAGLVFHGCGARFDASIPWGSVPVCSPSFVESSTATPFAVAETGERIEKPLSFFQEFETLPEWLPGWASGRRGYPSEIYHFSLAFPDEPVSVVVFRHVFLSSFRWYVAVRCSEDTRSRLRDRVG